MKLSQQLNNVFNGNTDCYGIYDLSQVRMVNGVKNKGKGITREGQIGLKEFSDHLRGKLGAGVVPVLNDGTCNFAVIDIDHYDLDYKKVFSKIQDSKFIACRSKSGGLHLYIFFKKPENCEQVIEAMTKVCKQIGFPGSEIFPKQTSIDVENKFYGSWINIPYYDLKNCNNPAICMKTLEPYPIEQFLQLVEYNRTTLKELKSQKVKKENIGELTIVDGPPCLEYLTQAGFPEGSRNRGLLALGVYYKKVNPDGYEELIEKANRKWMNPGTAEEVATIKKSIRNKEYKYTCKEQPLCDHCDRAVCLTRKYGIADGDSVKFPEINRIVKFLTYPPKYYMDINGVQVGPVSSEVFLKQIKFKEVCLEYLNLVVPTLKGHDWDKLMADLMAKIEEVEVGEENNVYGQLMEFFEDFITSHRVTDNKEELLASRVYREDGLVHFRMKDFQTFLKNNDFKELTLQSISAYFKNKGFTPSQIKIEDKKVRIWTAPESSDQEVEIQVTPQEDVL